MNTALFLDKCREVLPLSKDLNSSQWTAYREKLNPFTDEQRRRLFDAVLENCKRFPAIAEIYEQARNLGFANKSDRKPHTWTPTDCQLCGGSGLVAAFWSQEFEISEGQKTQILRLHYVFPYHQSGAYNRQKDHDDIRQPYRCLCDRGVVETLGKGIPRWSNEIPEVMRRNWAA